MALDRISSHVNRPVFFGAIVGLCILSLPLFIWPEVSAENLSTIKRSVDNNFGFVYQWLTIFVLAFTLWLSFSSAGHIRLGKEAPAFGMYSWASMIFCAGVATGILFWGGIEWAFYVNTPPFGIAPHSDAAMEWAASYGIFHWGPAGWAFYVLPGLAVGHAYYNLKIPSWRLSTACKGIIGEKSETFTGKLIDTLFVIGLLGSSGTSLGIGTPMVTALVDDLLGTGTHFEVKLVIIGLCSIIFAISVYLGLTEGIRRLSNLNTSLAFLFLGFILLLGPTVFLLKMTTNSLGLIGQNFLRMLTWTDPLQDSRFVEDWSIFYWAWWITVGPFMGIFIAKISAGRSFKQITLGTLFFGSAGCMLFYAIFGNYALFQEREGRLISTDMVVNGESAAAISEIIKTLPLGTLVLVFFAVMSLIFMATSFDSTSYVLASGTTKDLTEGKEPAKWLRLFWAFVLVVLPAGLMLVGGLEALKTTVLLSALPLIIVYILIILSLLKWTQEWRKG